MQVSPQKTSWTSPLSKAIPAVGTHIRAEQDYVTDLWHLASFLSGVCGKPYSS